MDDTETLRWRRFGQIATAIGPALRSAGQDELVASIAETAKRVFNAAACSVAILEDDGEHLVYHFVAGGSEKILGERIPVGTGIAGWVVATGQPLAVADVANDPRFSRDIADRTGFVPTSIVAVPLATEQRILGVLQVLDPAAGDDTELLMLFARLAALAVESGQLYDQLGNHLLKAVADPVDEPLGAVLRRLAAEADPLDPSLRRLAATFGELLQLGPHELTAAADIVDAYTRHALHRSR